MFLKLQQVLALLAFFRLGDSLKLFGYNILFSGTPEDEESGGNSLHLDWAQDKMRELCFPDTHLAHEMNAAKFLPTFKFKEILWSASPSQILHYVPRAFRSQKAIGGKKKTDHEVIFKWLSHYSFSTKELPWGYKPFGDGNMKRTFEELVKNNPFYTSCITSKKVGFKTKYLINSIDGDTTWYSKFVKLTDSFLPRVNAVFNDKFELESIKMYDTRHGMVREIITTEDDAISSLMLTISHYTESIHATIHVLHYMLIATLSYCSQHTALSEFVDQYTPSIGIKYFEVHNTLFGGSIALLVGGFFKGDGVKIRSLFRDMLSEWGTYKTADDFLKKFLLKNIHHDSELLIPEYKKHIALVPHMASEVSNYFAEKPEAKLVEIETKFARMMKNSGKGISSVSSLKTFIELMSATGILHGGTLSLTRSLFRPEVLSKVSDSDVYTSEDVRGIEILSGTILGLVPDHYVFGSNLVKDKALKSILKKYDEKSTDLKRQYFTKIKKNSEFKNLGWIWTDFGPDLVDDKQLTIATYI